MKFLIVIHHDLVQIYQLSVSSLGKVSCHRIRDLNFKLCLHKKLTDVLT